MTSDGVLRMAFREDPRSRPLPKACRGRHTGAGRFRRDDNPAIKMAGLNGVCDVAVEDSFFDGELVTAGLAGDVEDC